ncbi:OLC1v1009880C1 [Oldenlandia corymbosa var. corymbosa]|uniref:RING-type E3 ubiquitin transferase n=1 Tax=Oldenlandia corymbosa var. corymbosa TaxID=529605 RepID=A0AAV1DT54_OLDCO|nr:OLC1v1009880C1 [Oldenlandia corymbosa var. corymbosa]
MAGASNTSQLHQQNPPSTAVLRHGISTIEEREAETGPSVDPFDFHALSPPNLSFVVPSSYGDFGLTCSGTVSERFESVHSDCNFFHYRGGGDEDDDDDDDDDQMNFVTDLFGTRQGSSNDRNRFQIGSNCRDMVEEPELILGLGSSNTIASIDGLRVAGVDSESDSEDMEIDSGGDHGRLIQNDGLGSPDFWDCLQFDGQRERGSFTDEFEWEEVNIRENMTSLIDRIEQLSISSFSESSPFVNEEEENARNIEWQVLLAVNNLDLGSGYDEYNVQFGELVGEDGNVRGGPPAAKTVVESLPSIVLTIEDLAKSNVVCAVCKDDIPVGLNVTKLPCSHHYHKDCILPWLAIRNTCPLCRFELLTDDADYERRKNSDDAVAGSVDQDDSQVRYHYQLFPLE